MSDDSAIGRGGLEVLNKNPSPINSERCCPVKSGTP